MKKQYGLVLLIAFIFLLSGCGAYGTQPTKATSSISLQNTQVPQNSSCITPAPSITVVTSPSPSIMQVSTNDSISFNEAELLKDFPLGMEGKDVENKLTELGIECSQEVQSPYGDVPDDFLMIIADNDFVFHMDDHNRLFSIDDGSFETAKGLEPGDTIEEMRAIFGKEDEYDVIQDEYVYNRDNYVIIFSADTREDKVDLCSVSVNRWNYPDFNIPMKPLHGDNVILFNEDNFSKYFTFGMSKPALEKKLTELGVRISIEEFAQYDGVGDLWTIETDHIYFSFDQNEKLICIDTEGWATAKCLEIGATAYTLHKLYGKEKILNDNGTYPAGYIYNKKGYKVEFNFYDNRLAGWSIYGPGSVIVGE